MMREHDVVAGPAGNWRLRDDPGIADAFRPGRVCDTSLRERSTFPDAVASTRLDADRIRIVTDWLGPAR